MVGLKTDSHIAPIARPNNNSYGVSERMGSDGSMMTIDVLV